MWGCTVIVGTQGRINELLAGVKDEDIITFHVNNDHAWVLVSSEAAPIGEPIIQEKIVEKEIVKEIEVDNPKLLDKIVELKESLKVCQDNNKEFIAENAKLNKEIEKLKKQNDKLKAALTQ